MILNLAFLLGFSQIGWAQNFSVELTLLSGLVLPDSGGTISYRLTVTNLSGHPQSCDIWGTVTRPNGTTQPVPGQTTETFLGNQSMTWQRQETLPPRAPVGYYTLKAFVGLYPSTIWAQAEFQFQKQVLTGGVQQEWVARYNGIGGAEDVAHDMAVDRQGNVIVTGRSYAGISGHDYSTIKYDPSGILQWASLYNGPGNGIDEAFSIAVDSNNNIYVTGKSRVTAINYDYTTIKYNAMGIEQWIARYNGLGFGGDDFATALAVDVEGNVLVTGYSLGIGTGYDYATVKYNTSGMELWAVRYDGPANYWDEAHCITTDYFCNVYVAGFSYGSNSDYDYATVKYDVNGIQQWFARYNGPGNGYDRVSDIAVDLNGNVYVTGYSENNTGYDYTTIKYNIYGVQQWVARFDASYDDEATGLVVDENGSVYVTGFSAGFSTGFDYTTIKYDSSGFQQWVAHHNGILNGHDFSHAISLDQGGNIYITGDVGNSGNNYDDNYCTIKYNSLGVQQWVAGYNGPADQADQPCCIVADLQCNIYVTGKSPGIGTHYDYATIKYTQPAILNWQEVTTVPFGAPLPQESRLEAPSPNPFNQMTDVRYQMTDNRYVSLKVYDTAGREVATLVNGWRQAGSHEVTFDPTGAGGSRLASGVYFVRMEVSGSRTTPTTEVQKMVLLK
jgi:uncharacterized delta-60 repeat protein